MVLNAILGLSSDIGQRHLHRHEVVARLVEDDVVNLCHLELLNRKG